MLTYGGGGPKVIKCAYVIYEWPPNQDLSENMKSPLIIIYGPSSLPCGLFLLNSAI